MFLRLSTCAVAMLLAASPAAAGVIRGVYRSPTAATQSTEFANPYVGRAGSLPGTRVVVRGAVMDAVVYVERIPISSESLLASRARRQALAQKDQAFVPRVLAVAVGGTVDFPNQDPIYHNVFSVSPTRRFDLGKYAKGKSKSITFTKPGLVNVFCDIHSDMAAFVLVVPNHAFTRPRADGHYELPALPAGSYVVKTWHPDLPPTERRVDVPAAGAIAIDLGS